jgi:hypothetical protein
MAASRVAARELARGSPHHPVVFVGPGVVVDRWQRGRVTLASAGTLIAEPVLRASILWATAFGAGIEVIELEAAARGRSDATAYRPYLNAVCRRIAYAGTSVGHRTLTHDDTVGAVVRFLRESDSPLVVLASDRLDDDKLGRVGCTEFRLIDESPCPILLLPSRNRRATD